MRHLYGKDLRVRKPQRHGLARHIGCGTHFGMTRYAQVFALREESVGIVDDHLVEARAADHHLALLPGSPLADVPQDPGGNALSAVSGRAVVDMLAADAQYVVT